MARREGRGRSSTAASDQVVENIGQPAAHSNPNQCLVPRVRGTGSSDRLEIDEYRAYREITPVMPDTDFRGLAVTSPRAKIQVIALPAWDLHAASQSCGAII